MRFLDVLMEEHRGFKVMLDVLDAIAERLARGAAVPPPMLADVLDFFERFAERHHDREEETLFPLLAKHGLGSDQTVVRALMTQHETGRVYGAKMRSAETRVHAGDPGAAVELAEHAKAYTELIREHIRIEDEYFYKLAGQLLTLAEQESVVARFVGEAGVRPPSAERTRYLKMLSEYPAVVAGWRS